MHKTATAVVLAAGLLLTSCSTESGEIGEAATGSNAQAPASASAEQAPAPNPKFGETFNYENGLSVTVSSPEPYTPSDSAALGSEPNNVKFNVKVVNGTQENFNLAGVYATVQSGNTEGTPVFDSANGIESAPPTPLLPGRESTWDLVFGVTDPADIVMQIQPGVFELDPIIYTL